jgi:hypothetical protein
MLARSNPELAAELLKEAQDDVERQWRVYSARAAMPGRGETPHIAPEEKKAEEKLAAVVLPEVRMIDFSTQYLGLKLKGPDRGVVDAAVGVDRQHSPHGRCGRIGDRADFAVRGAVGAGVARAGRGPLARHRVVCRVARLSAGSWTTTA